MILPARARIEYIALLSGFVEVPLKWTLWSTEFDYSSDEPGLYIDVNVIAAGAEYNRDG